MPSPYCAWCGKPLTVGVTVAGVVVYHEFCRCRRVRVLGGPASAQKMHLYVDTLPTKRA
jgi:hypothetical protein